MPHPALLFIALAMLLLALLLLRSRWERRQLCVERYQIPARADSLHMKLSPAEELQCGPESFPAAASASAFPAEGEQHCTRARLRLAFLSDLHGYAKEQGAERILDCLEREQPELVLLGGDMITCRKDADWQAETVPVLSLIREMTSRCLCLYAEGNHETYFRERHPEAYADYRQALEETGVVLLQNAHVSYRGVTIYGLTMEECFYRKMLPGLSGRQPMPQDYLLKKLGLPEKNRYNILLMHSPMYLQEAADWGADLVLSGHFHGGTVRLPLPGNPGLMTPQYQFLVKECSGQHITSNHRTRMIVSRGIGTHSVNLRLNDLPEVTIVDLIQTT